ncbi:fibrinogen gamma chain-like [Tubulanus polymorphus]|uniref:fibrinogen gamma chain-like n=1 Tax=Tubulanus polymorphus TaxID=672921 RepID=UPI003DA6944A
MSNFGLFAAHSAVIAVVLIHHVESVKMIPHPINSLKFRSGHCNDGIAVPSKAIDAHVVVRSAAECARVCMEHRKCISFNYRRHGEGVNCELTGWRSHDCSKLETRLGWKFYLPENPCLNHGKLDIVDNVRVCSCVGAWVGKFCEIRVTDCASYIDHGAIDDGFHVVFIHPPTADHPFHVRCTFSGKTAYYILAQRIYDKENIPGIFNKTWADYKYGFRTNSMVFWLGNDKIYHIAHPESRFHSLCFYFVLNNGSRFCTFYSGFTLSPEEHGYAMTTDHVVKDVVTASCIVNKVDVLNPDKKPGLRSQGMKFSTYDRDQDQSDRNCAREFGGGWWYRNCTDLGLTVASMSNMFWSDVFNNTNNTGPTKIEKMYINLWQSP